MLYAIVRDTVAGCLDETILMLEHTVKELDNRGVPYKAAFAEIVVTLKGLEKLAKSRR